MSAPKKKAGWGAGEAALLAAIDRGEVSAAYMAVAQPLSGLDNTKPLAKLDKACRQAERFLDVAMTRAGTAPCSAAQRKAAEHAATTALDKLFQTRWKDAPPTSPRWTRRSARASGRQRRAGRRRRSSRSRARSAAALRT